MARIFSKSGEVLIVPTPKKTYQGQGRNSKFSSKSNSHGKKKLRGQGRK